MAKKTYEPAPEVPPELRDRYATMVEVIQGRLTVSEGARRLGMSRNHFQTLLHRGLKGLLEGITPGEPGRPGKPPRETELARENERRQENERLRGRTEMIDRLLGVASGVIRGRVRSARTRKASPEGGTSDGDDPDPGLEVVMRVEAERQLREAGLPAPLSCAVVGASPATSKPRMAPGTVTTTCSAPALRSRSMAVSVSRFTRAAWRRETPGTACRSASAPMRPPRARTSVSGPPRHPGYYGQLERQNREHRAWLAHAGRLDPADLDRLCDEMLLALKLHGRGVLSPGVRVTKRGRRAPRST